MDDMAQRLSPMDRSFRAAVSPDGSGGLLGKLAAAWVVLLVLGAAVFFFLPPLPAFFLFWALTVAMALVTVQSLHRTGRTLYRMTCLMDQAGHMFWAVDSAHCLTAAWGAVALITGRPSEDLTGTPLTRLLSEEHAKALGTVLSKGLGFSMEVSIPRPKGPAMAVEISGRPLPGETGAEFIGVIRSLQEVKGQESRIRDMKRKLGRSEKLKNLGLLAGSVAHDLNNILSGIATYPEVLLMEPSLDQKTRKGIEMIKDSGRKASSVVSDLLTISRGARADRQVLNINTVIQRYMGAAEFEKIEQTYPDVEIETNLEPELLNMRGSYVHIEKAVMNLMLNAVEETTGREGKGRVRLSTANYYVDNEGEKALAGGEYVMLSVADNGSGIPADFQDKIFDPFFTQKEMGKSGTGLGLTVVHNTVQDHRGDIRVVSDGGGTRFDLFFPAIREELPKTKDPNSLEEIRGRGETVLIVDDLSSQRKIGATILSKLGYKVFTVADGMAAVDFVREQPVDLLVLDMIMAPSISGLETYRLIREIRPGQRAIIASGHSESEDVLKTQALGAGSFVKKPYTVMDMGIAVKEELEK